MSRVFDPVLRELRETLLLMGGRAEAILDKAVRAVLERDAALAGAGRRRRSRDRPARRRDRRGGAEGARAPGAGGGGPARGGRDQDDRDRSRAGGRPGAQHREERAAPEPPRWTCRFRPSCARLAASAKGVLRSALDAFSQADPRAAHRVLGSDDEIDHAQDEVILEEIEQISSHPDMASPGGRHHLHRQEPRAGRRSRHQHRRGRDPGGRSAQREARRQAGALTLLRFVSENSPITPNRVEPVSQAATTLLSMREGFRIERLELDGDPQPIAGFALAWVARGELRARLAGSDSVALAAGDVLVVGAREGGALDTRRGRAELLLFRAQGDWLAQALSLAGLELEPAQPRAAALRAGRDPRAPRRTRPARARAVSRLPGLRWPGPAGRSSCWRSGSPRARSRPRPRPAARARGAPRSMRPWNSSARVRSKT